MPIIQDFALVHFEDGIITVNMAPPESIYGWSIQFAVYTHFQGATPLILKSCATGFNGVSGITVTDPLEGVFDIQINSSETSGLDCTAYAYQVVRNDTNSHIVISEGYLLLQP